MDDGSILRLPFCPKKSGKSFIMEQSSKEDQSNIYMHCALNEDGKCGRSRKFEDRLFKADELNDDVQEHLSSLKTSGVVLKFQNERNLIQNRIDRTLDNDDRLCGKHREANGKFWRRPKYCFHPDHPKPSKGKKSCKIVTASYKHILELTKSHDVNIPIGAGLCIKHRKALATLTGEVDETDDDDDPDDPEYEPDEPLLPDSFSEAGNSNLNESPLTAALEALEGSPLKFQVKRKHVDDLSEATKVKIKQKYQRAKVLLKKQFAASVAPGQDENILSFLSDSDFSDDDLEIEDDIKYYQELYKKGDSKNKMVILSLIDPHRLSKERLRSLFGCTKYQVDQARKWRANNDTLTIPMKEKLKRHKIDINKCEHFLDFVFNSGLLQDVAYGVTTVIYDNGFEEKIAHAVLTTKYSHTIALYQKFCTACQYQPLSESSLWRILKEIKPSKRKCLGKIWYFSFRESFLPFVRTMCA